MRSSAKAENDLFLFFSFLISQGVVGHVPAGPAALAYFQTFKTPFFGLLRVLFFPVFNVLICDSIAKADIHGCSPESPFYTSEEDLIWIIDYMYALSNYFLKHELTSSVPQIN